MNLKLVLSRGFKYTICCFHDQYGYLEAHQIKLVCVSIKLIKPLEKIASTIIVNEGPPGLNKFIVLKPKAQYVIWKGHHQVNTSVIVSREEQEIKGHKVMVEKKWPAFDGRYLLRAKRSVKIEPVAEFIKPLGEEVLSTYQCIANADKH